ncbi:MAG: DHA2 family efflux MFS transporter permease subunit [Alphaproteobacteria bacterium]|nr:DHA2 family efflux MFS transporter permease subunit [Alphaproteobacteria bacterium]
MLAASTMVVSGTIVNVAVPDVMGAYGLGQSEVQLMSTAFMIAMTTGQLLNAWVVAVIGQRWGFLATLTLFIIGSLVAGFAENFGMIVFGRVLQGIAAGVIQPLVMVTLFQAFPEGKRGSALGLYVMGLVGAASIGPPMGGLVIEYFNWRYIFFAPLVLVAIALPLGAMFMPSVRSDNPPRFDWIGFVLISVSLYCIMTAVSNGAREGWESDYIVSLFIISFVAAAAFLQSQRREGASMLDLSLFKNKMFAIAVLVTSFSAIGNFASVYAVPVAAQLVQNMTPFEAGLALMPSMMLAMFIMPISGRLSDKIPPHIAIITGFVFLTAGVIPFAFADANTSFTMIMIYGLIGRWATAFVQPFIMNTALNSLPKEKLNAGGGAINFCRQLVGSLGTNLWVVIVDWRIDFHASALTSAQSAATGANAEFLRGVEQIYREAGVPEADRHAGGLYYLGQVIEAQANALGFQDGFWFLAISYAAGIVPAWYLGRLYNKSRRK